MNTSCSHISGSDTAAGSPSNLHSSSSDSTIKSFKGVEMSKSQHHQRNVDMQEKVWSENKRGNKASARHKAIAQSTSYGSTSITGDDYDDYHDVDPHCRNSQIM